MATSYVAQSPLPGKRNPVRIVMVTACIVAVMDGLAAVAITFFMHGRSPRVVFQYIASGLLGTSAFSGGLTTIIIGVLCHFFIAGVWTAIFFFLHPAFSKILPNKILKGLVYGGITWAGMNLVVLPLSQVPPGTPSVLQIMIGITALVLAAGLPLAFRFDRYYFQK